MTAQQDQDFVDVRPPTSGMMGIDEGKEGRVARLAVRTFRGHV